MAVGDRIEVDVERIAHGGHCVARVDGRVLFVRHALPGERVVAAVTEDRGKSHFFADAVEVLAASADRVVPGCPVSGPGGCGGCDFQHVAPAAQRELKAAVVAEQLSRLGGVEWPVTVEELPGGPRWRTRVRFAVDPSGAVGFRAWRSHRVVPVGDCPITMDDCVKPVAGQRFTLRGEVSAVLDNRPAVTVVETPPARSGRRGRPHVVSGDGVAVQRAAGQEFRLSATDFWQIHPAAAETFASVVAEFAAVRDGDAVWDLYGGVGLFAAALAGRAGSVTVVESARSAVASGQSSVPDARFVTGDVAKVLATGELPSPDVVVLDPPRRGAGAGVLGAIAAAQPRRVVYVACDPAALGRDVRTLAGHGLALRELRAFDAFPMTHHVECIALFTR